MRTAALLATIVITIVVFAIAAVFTPVAVAGGNGGGEPICSLPADPGPCDGVYPRWYHNNETGICEPFIYGGCEGNANNFETLADCQYACMDICLLLPVYGPCQGAIPRWYFNAQSGGCEQFIWGGCEPNANNFSSLAECEMACGGRVSPCQLPLEPGECEGDPGWYYLPLDNTCKQVPPGWCGTDFNRYESEEECLDSCYQQYCHGDLNGDGTVGVPDLLILIQDWGKNSEYWNPIPSDLTFDGTVGVPDLLFLISVWDTCYSPW